MKPKVLLAILLCCAPAWGWAKGSGTGKGNGSPSPAAQMQASHRSGSSGFHATMGVEHRPAPPLDSKRRVSVQDCTKPVDLTQGNLKCR